MEPIRLFVGELGRRRVFRTAALYVIVAVVLLEATEALMIPLELPLSALTLVTWAAILGFPLAVGLAWTFDVTPHGIVRTPPDSEEDRRRRQLSTRIGLRLTLTGAAAAAVGATTWMAMEPLLPRAVDEGSEIGADAFPSGTILVAPVVAGEDVDAGLGGKATVLILRALSGLPGMEPVDPRRAHGLREGGSTLDSVALELDVGRVLEARLEPSPEGVRLITVLRDPLGGVEEVRAEASGPAEELGRLVTRVVGGLAISRADEN
jgi:hypothetical protein